GVGPVLHAALDDPPVDLVELRLADQERVVLGGDLVARRGEVESDAVGGVDLPEVTEAARRGKAEQLGEPVRRGVRIAGSEDRVIELDGHRLHLAAPSHRWRGTGQWVSTFELHTGSYPIDHPLENVPCTPSPPPSSPPSTSVSCVPPRPPTTATPPPAAAGRQRAGVRGLPRRRWLRAPT